MNEKLFYAIPLGVLRQMVNTNSEEDDTYLQLFELTPDAIFTRQELEEMGGQIKEKGAIIYGKGE